MLDPVGTTGSAATYETLARTFLAATVAFSIAALVTFALRHVIEFVVAIRLIRKLRKR
jgi:hypothetical protein